MDHGGRFVGRVGALAVALGVGSAVAWMPAIAFADTTGSSGSTGSAEPSSPDSSAAATQRIADPCAPDGKVYLAIQSDNTVSVITDTGPVPPGDGGDGGI